MFKFKTYSVTSCTIKFVIYDFLFKIVEEMFGSSTALWFSKDANHLAYIKFNDAEVDNFQYPIYGEPGDRETVYPKWREIRYPKVIHI